MRAERIRLGTIRDKTARMAEAGKLRDRALASMAVHEKAITASGGTIVRRLPFCASFVVSAKDAAAGRMRTNAVFSRVAKNRSFAPSSLPRATPNPIAQSTANAPWNGLAYHKTLLTRGTQGTFPAHGQGTTIAFFDTGLDSNEVGGPPDSASHETFSSPTTGMSRLLDNIKVGLVDVNDVPNPIAAMGRLHHGTGVASIALGKQLDIAAQLSVPEGQAPEATAVCFGIANDAPFALTDSVTYLMAIEELRMRLLAGPTLPEENIRVLNISYAGWPDPMDPVEAELDWLANEFDLLVVTSAGNQGDATLDSHGAWNGLAVGGVSRQAEWDETSGGGTTTKTAGNLFDPMRVSPPAGKAGTARGPLFGYPDRQFPDLVAMAGDHVFKELPLNAGFLSNHISMAQADWMASNPPAPAYRGIGTSMAAPQVSGAAALYFAERPLATALEVKAAILASTERARLPNAVSATDTGVPNLFHSHENTFGSGFLRVDWLGNLCQRQSLSSERAMVSQHSVSTSTVQVPYAAFAGAPVGTMFTVVLAWERQSGELEVADLDLRVRLDMATSPPTSDLRRASSRRLSSYEHLTFELPGGVANIVVEILPQQIPGPSPLTAQLVVRALPPGASETPAVAGTVEYTDQPSGCATYTVNDQSVALVLPAGYDQAYGSGGWEREFMSAPTLIPPVYANPRLQVLRPKDPSTNPNTTKYGIVDMWFDESHFPASTRPFEIRGIALRCWRGGPHSKRHAFVSQGSFTLPKISVELQYSQGPAMPSGVARTATFGPSYSFVNSGAITPKGVTQMLPDGVNPRIVGAPMVVPRRWDDWTVFIPIPAASHPGFPAYFTVSDQGLRGGASSGPFTHGVFIRLAIMDTSGPELRGIDWVMDGGSGTYAMRQSKTSHASFTDFGGTSLVLGLISGQSVVTRPSLRVVGEPHVGGSFYVIASQFQKTVGLNPGPVAVSWSQTLLPPSMGCTWFLGVGSVNYAAFPVDGVVPHGTEFTVPLDRTYLFQTVYIQAQQAQGSLTRLSDLATVRFGGRF